MGCKDLSRYYNSGRHYFNVTTSLLTFVHVGRTIPWMGADSADINPEKCGHDPKLCPGTRNFSGTGPESGPTRNPELDPDRPGTRNLTRMVTDWTGWTWISLINLDLCRILSGSWLQGYGTYLKKNKPTWRLEASALFVIFWSFNVHAQILFRCHIVLSLP